MIEITCEQCLKKFKTYPCRDRKNQKLVTHRTCSKKCWYALLSKLSKGTGNNFFGKTHTRKTIKKIRERHLGKPVWNKGRHNVYSSETLVKMKTARAKYTKEKHPNWKGGRRNFRGYISIYSPDHPFRDKNNCVREHRLIMEKYLNRLLKPGETIHHINGIKNDNRIENLKLFSNNQEHMLYHGLIGTIKGRPKHIKQLSQN